MSEAIWKIKSGIYPQQDTGTNKHPGDVKSHQLTKCVFVYGLWEKAGKHTQENIQANAQKSSEPEIQLHFYHANSFDQRFHCKWLKSTRADEKCRPGRDVDGRRGGSLVHLWIRLLSVDSPLRQKTQGCLSSFTSSSVPLLLFSHLLSAPVCNRAQPISVCLHDSHLLIECLSECQCGCPRTLMGVK